MTRYPTVLFPLLALLLSGACPQADEKENKIPEKLRALLEKAEKFELLSLSPDDREEKPKDAFHGWRVLGRTTVKDAEIRKKLVAAFEKGVAENKGIVAKCFNPRHGIRLTVADETADFVICFECYQVKAFIGDKQAEGFLVTDSPKGVFDDVLKEANVPLPAKP
jgi:hypothetical protein